MIWDGNATTIEGKFKCWQTIEDILNYEFVIPRFNPSVVVEVGPGELGIVNLLKSRGLNVVSVGEKDEVPKVENAFIILDGDVYNQEVMKKDIETYSPMAAQLVICHTIRKDWGSFPAFITWYNPKEFGIFHPPHETRHTWLVKI